MHKLVSLLLLITLVLPALAQDQPYRVGNGVTPPKVTERVQPKYTPEAKDAKIEGAVVLSTVISKEGIPEEIKVVKSLDPGLERNAVEALEQWRFDPGKKDGKPVRVEATVEINFRLMD